MRRPGARVLRRLVERRPLRQGQRPRRHPFLGHPPQLLRNVRRERGAAVAHARGTIPATAKALFSCRSSIPRDAAVRYLRQDAVYGEVFCCDLTS